MIRGHYPWTRGTFFYRLRSRPRPFTTQPNPFFFFLSSRVVYQSCIVVLCFRSLLPEGDCFRRTVRLLSRTRYRNLGPPFIKKGEQNWSRLGSPKVGIVLVVDETIGFLFQNYIRSVSVLVLLRDREDIFSLFLFSLNVILKSYIVSPW